MAQARVTVDNKVNDPDTGQPKTGDPVTATASDQPRGWVVVVSLVVVAAGAEISWLLFRHYDPAPIQVSSTYVPLAGFIIVATALERLLQPLSYYLLGTSGAADATDVEQKTAAAATAGADASTSAADVKAKAQEAADATVELPQLKNERAIVYWAIASVIGMLIAACFGFMLIASVAKDVSTVNRFFDIVVTGLAIGAGTKPLHDLFTSIQASSSKSSS